jgi:hypothetical protein
MCSTSVVELLAIARSDEHGCFELTVDSTVASGLGPDQATTPAATLAGKNTLPLVGKSTVGTEHVADLAASDTNVTSGHISLGTNVLVKLTHETVAEAADLAVRLALGVEVRATLATAHVEAGQGVLENLLETQELEHAEVDCRVQSEATLVGAESGVELHSEGIVDLDLALVVLPHYAELDDALWDGDYFEGIAVLGVLLEERAVLEGGGKLCSWQSAYGLNDLNGSVSMRSYHGRPAGIRARGEG